MGFQEKDIYGQYDLNKNLRIIAGSKDLDNDSSKFYGGIGVTAPLDSKVDGYSSLVVGSEFKELQVGANINVSHDFDININYRSLMPDHGGNNNPYIFRRII